MTAIIMAWFSFGCLGAAAVAPLEVRMIAAGLQPLVGSATRGALASPWVLQPVFSRFSALSPSWLWITLPSLTVLAVVRVAKRLQSGRLDAYMTYMLIALVAVLAVVTATA